MEVGKKYKYRAHSPIYECFFITPDGNALLKSGSNEFLLQKSHFHLYPEYKESLKGDAWAVFYKSPTGHQYRVTFDEEVEMQRWIMLIKGYEILAMKKISWTKGDTE